MATIKRICQNCKVKRKCMYYEADDDRLCDWFNKGV